MIEDYSENRGRSGTIAVGKLGILLGAEAGRGPAGLRQNRRSGDPPSPGVSAGLPASGFAGTSRRPSRLRRASSCQEAGERVMGKVIGRGAEGDVPGGGLKMQALP